MKKFLYIIILIAAMGNKLHGQQAASKNTKVVMLDSYFNDEHRKDSTGKMISYHYKWEDQTNDGFSIFGDVFRQHGFDLSTLYQAPTSLNLLPAKVYIIVDPDIPQENPTPQYIQPENIDAICKWVKAGGQLVVLNNDTGNAEFVHLNKLMERFGIQFNYDSRNHVDGTKFEQGAIYIHKGNEIFNDGPKIYLKGISTLKITKPAVAVLKDKSDIIIATSKYGKGNVFAVGDPWLYNEYITWRRLPHDFQNLEAANDLVDWLAAKISDEGK